MIERELFLGALEHHDPRSRANYLDRACADDTALRARVDALLKSHEEAGNFLEEPVAYGIDATCAPTVAVDPDVATSCATPAASPGSALPPTEVGLGATQAAGAGESDATGAWGAGASTIEATAGSTHADHAHGARRDGTRGTHVGYFGDYELLREIARGGMGVVYRARQVSLNRPVALKMILAGQLASEADVKRFYLEAESAANLDHPGIVPIYEIGEHEGQHFFSMGFVEGTSLAAKVADGPLAAREAATLTMRVAEAVQYAHDKGVIHRDLKPANVLLDAQGHPKVTDFGLAKKLQGDSGLTHTGQVMGTPSYMPPEQADGRAVGPAADVYALGAILYCLLTGRPPFQAASPMDTLLQVVGQEPVPPRQLNPAVPRDLETICLRCLEKEPGKRYARAAALAEDLHHYLEGEPIAARPVSRSEKAWKWARRRPAIAALSASVVVVALIGLVGIAWQWRKALANLAEAETQKTKALDNLTQANLQRGLAQLRGRESAEKAESLKHQLYFNRIHLAQSEWISDSSTAAADVLERCPAELRNWEWSYMHRLCHLEMRVIEGGGRGLDFSPDGQRIASADPEHRVRVWDTAQGGQLLSLAGHTEPVYAVAFSPDGHTIASGSQDTTIKLWDADTGALLRTMEPKGSWVRSLAFSPDGSRLVSGSGAELFTPGKTAELILWDVAAGTEIRRFAGPHDRIYGVAYRPDGKQIASINCEASLKLWDPETGALEHRLAGHSYYIECVAYSPDGLTIATGGRDHVALLWDVKEAKVRYTLRGHDSHVTCLAFSPDGKTLITGDSDAALKLWDVASGAEVAHLRVASGLSGIRCDHDGGLVATTGYDGAVRLWDATTLRRVEHVGLPGHRGWSYRAAYSGDGKVLATTGWGLVRFWDPTTGRHLRDVEMGFPSGVYGFALRPDGRVIATAQERGPMEVNLWDVETGQRLRQLEGHDAGVRCLAFAPDGRTLASAGDDLTVRLWDASSGSPLARLEGHTATVETVIFSPDGKLLASQALDNTIRLWDAATGQEVRVLAAARKGSYTFGNSLAFSPDGGTLASARSDALVTLWDLNSGAEVVTLAGHRSQVNAVVFLSRSRLVTTSDDRTIKLWDVPTGECVLTLRGHSGAVIGLACRPDGTQFTTTGTDEPRIWTASETGAPPPWANPVADRPPAKPSDVAPRPITMPAPRARRLLTGHLAQVNRLAYTPDGLTLATASDDKTVRLWDTRTSTGRAVLRGHTDHVVSLAIAPDGRTLASATGDWRRPNDPPELKLWDIASGTFLADLKGHAGPVWSLAFAPDSQTLASGSSDGLVKLWDLDRRAERKTLNFGTGEWVRGLAFTPDGAVLASSHMATVRLWDVAKSERIADLKGHDEEINALAISPDGQTLATASRDKTVILWDRGAAKKRQTLTGNNGWVNDVAFSPDGKTLAIGVMDGAVKLWDVASGALKASDPVKGGCTFSVAFSPDGTTVAAGQIPFVLLWRVPK